jgi:hypothetical protein
MAYRLCLRTTGLGELWHLRKFLERLCLSFRETDMYSQQHVRQNFGLCNALISKTLALISNCIATSAVDRTFGISAVLFAREVRTCTLIAGISISSKWQSQTSAIGAMGRKWSYILAHLRSYTGTSITVYSQVNILVPLHFALLP